MHKLLNSVTLFILVVGLLCLASCGAGGTSHSFAETPGDTIPLEYARNLTLVKHGDYIRADIRNPWDTVKTLRSYLLVADSLPVPHNTAGLTVIRTPLKNSVVYSAVHQGLIDELGALPAITGIVDRQYITSENLKRHIEEGKAIDCGTVTTPDIERIIRLNPDGILLSPFGETGGYGKIETLGIPLVECVDYTENHPLARAEWMKFFGMLYGRGTEADSMFAATKEAYLRLRDKNAKKEGNKPKIILDGMYGQTWNAPGAGSLMDFYISDAGGVNPFRDAGDDFNVPLSAEQALTRGADADIWLVRYWQDNEKSLAELRRDNPIYGRFKPLAEGNVWGCNTRYVPFFDEVPFHPHLFLEDLIEIIDGDAANIRYFKKMK